MNGLIQLVLIVIFITAVFDNSVEIVELMLKDGRIQPNIKNNICIVNAINRKYIKIVKLLLNDDRIYIKDIYEKLMKSTEDRELMELLTTKYNKELRIFL